MCRVCLVLNECDVLSEDVCEVRSKSVVDDSVVVIVERAKGIPCSIKVVSVFKAVSAYNVVVVIGVDVDVEGTVSVAIKVVSVITVVAPFTVVEVVVVDVAVEVSSFVTVVVPVAVAVTVVVDVAVAVASVVNVVVAVDVVVLSLQRLHRYQHYQQHCRPKLQRH